MDNLSWSAGGECIPSTAWSAVYKPPSGLGYTDERVAGFPKNKKQYYLKKSVLSNRLINDHTKCTRLYIPIKNMLHLAKLKHLLSCLRKVVSNFVVCKI